MWQFFLGKTTFRGGVFFLWPPNWGPVGPMNGEIVGQKIKIKKKLKIRLV